YLSTQSVRGVSWSGDSLWHVVQQCVDDRIRAHSLRIAFEVQQDTVTQRRISRPSNIREVHVRATLQDGVYFARPHQRLSATRAAAKTHVLPHLVRRILAIAMRRQHQ